MRYLADAAPVCGTGPARAIPGLWGKQNHSSKNVRRPAGPPHVFAVFCLLFPNLRAAPGSLRPALCGPGCLLFAGRRRAGRLKPEQASLAHLALCAKGKAVAHQNSLAD